MKPYKGQELGESKITHGDFEHLGTDKYEPPTKHCIHCNNVFRHDDPAELRKIFRRHMERKHPEIKE